MEDEDILAETVPTMHRVNVVHVAELDILAENVLTIVQITHTDDLHRPNKRYAITLQTCLYLPLDIIGHQVGKPQESGDGS